MNRPKTSGKDLPQKMLRRVRTLASGAVGDAWAKWKTAQVRPEQFELEAT